MAGFEVSINGRFSGVHRGRDFIPAIVKLYQVFDLLACEFLFPSVARQVVAHRQGGSPRGDDWVDMSVVVSGLKELRESGPGLNRGAGLLLRGQKGVRYEIPKRSLACSDVAISWLKLDPGFHTTDNSHPGYELLLPIEGSVSVEYMELKDPRVCTVAAQEHVAHYNSRVRHRIHNTGDGPATMFLVRFYGEGKDSIKNASSRPHEVRKTGRGRRRSGARGRAAPSQ
jgi:hypothetical protein